MLCFVLAEGGIKSAASYTLVREECSSELQMLQMLQDVLIALSELSAEGFQFGFVSALYLK